MTVNSYKKKSSLLLFSIFFSINLFIPHGKSHAQELLLLSDAMSFALGSHPSVTGKKNEVSAAANGVESAKWQKFPAVSGQTLPARAGNGTTTLVRIQQPLWAGGRIDANIDASEARLLSTQASLDDAKQNILLKVAVAYTDMLKLSEKIEASNINFTECKRLVDLIQSRTEGQINSESDLIAARARLASAKNERLQFITLFNNSKADLEQLMSQKVEKISMPKINYSLVSKDVNRITQLAWDFSPQLRKLSYDLKAAEAQIQVKKSLLWPQLSANFDTYNGGSTYPDNMAYLSLNFQPGNGLSSLSSIREAEAQKTVSESSGLTGKKDIQDRIRIDFNLHESSFSQIDVLKELSESTNDVYESYLRQFAASRKTWLEVLNARREATQAKYSLADARWNFYVSSLRLKINAGLINENELDVNVQF